MMMKSCLKISEFDHLWSNMYEEEEALLKTSLCNYIYSIHHIGSTSIPNMPSKPIIDILLEVNNLEDISIIEQRLIKQGYTRVSRSVILNYSYFCQKNRNDINFNCHIYEKQDPQVQRLINFRDYLISHHDKALEYAILKKKLISIKPFNLTEYVKKKEPFVRKIDAAAKVYYQNRKDKELSSCLNTIVDKHLTKRQNIINSIEANFNISKTYYPQYLLSYDFIRIPGYCLINSNFKKSIYNSIIDTHFSTKDADKKINELVGFFKQKKLPFIWWVTPNDKPTNLSQILKANNLKRKRDHVGLFVNLNDLKIKYNESLNTLSIDTDNDFTNLIGALPKTEKVLRKYITLIAKIYTPNDPIRFYYTRYNDEIISCHLLVTYANVAGIYQIYKSKNCSSDMNTEIEHFLLGKAKIINYKYGVLLKANYNLSKYTNSGFSKVCIFNKFEYSA